MAGENFVSHVTPSGETMADRVRRAGKSYRVLGENIRKLTNASAPAEKAVSGWMKSQGHRENILTREFTETGVGVCRRGRDHYFTQIFVQPG